MKQNLILSVVIIFSILLISISANAASQKEKYFCKTGNGGGFIIEKGITASEYCKSYKDPKYYREYTELKVREKNYQECVTKKYPQIQELLKAGECIPISDQQNLLEYIKGTATEENNLQK